MRHIVGITRFALTAKMGMGEGQFYFPHRKAPAHLSRKEWVYSKGYLEHRLQLWLAFAQPTIAALCERIPPDCRYTHLVAINPDLPIKDGLKLTLPWNTHLAEVSSKERLERALRPHLTDLVEGSEYFTFRLDDDDALAPDYLQLVADYWEAGHQVITPTEGYFVGIDRQKAHEPLRMVPAVNEGSPHGIGAYNAFIHDFGKHNAIPCTHGIRGLVYWLRSVHRSNVSLAGHPGSAWGRGNTEVSPASALARFPHLSQSAITEALRRDPV